MKLKILFLCAALIAAVTGYAQQSQAAPDSTKLEWLPDLKTETANDSCFYQVEYFSNEEGGYNINAIRLGDTTATLNAFAGSVVQNFRTLASAAKVFYDEQKIIAYGNGIETLFTSRGLPSVNEFVKAQVVPGWLGNYKVRYNGEIKNGTIVQKPNGTFRISWTGQSELNFIIRSDVNARVLNLGGQNYEIYKIGEGKFANITGAIILTKKQ